MAKTDKVTMNHVSAAKKWLGKAQDSLEHDNNIRGDLHIMLAEAELKRAREKRSSHVNFWNKYALPLFLSSLFLAGGGFFLANHSHPVIKTIASPVVSADTAAKRQEAPVKAVQPDQQNTQQSMTQSEPAAIDIDTGQQPAEAPPVKQAEVTYTSDRGTAEPTKEIKVPSREMQQMMRAAKNTLQK